MSDRERELEARLSELEEENRALRQSGEIVRLGRDLREAAKLMGRQEARYLVDMYYQVQHFRIQASNQLRASSEEPEPVYLLDWLGEQFMRLEGQIKGALGKYVDGHEFGAWTRSICGIGPVIAAGLIAHIDIEKAPTPGHIWSFAGLLGENNWEKGQKRPYNAELKTLCAFKLGESFVKVQVRELDVYGKVFKERKIREQERNERGEFRGEAEAKLAKYKIGKSTDAYKWYSEGKLPPAHIHARARRVAVKLFLAHLQQVWWFIKFDEPPPKPFAIEHLGHADLIMPPNLHLVPGFRFRKSA